MNENFWLAVILTLIAGLSTGFGSFLIFFEKKLNPKLLAISLGFSAGVMVYVSFMEILPEAFEQLGQVFGSEKSGELWGTIWFFIGIAIIAIIDRLVPDYENPHEIKNTDMKEFEKNQKLLRMGIFSAIAIAAHNIPEGLATFVSTMQNPEIGFSIAVAIAIHNIPEGIAVAVPIYYATKNKMKASLLSLGSGFAEVIGGIGGYFLVVLIFGEINFGYIFAIIAGIMVYISLDELFPTAEKYGEHHVVIGGFVAGMLVMATSLVLL